MPIIGIYPQNNTEYTEFHMSDLETTFRQVSYCHVMLNQSHYVDIHYIKSDVTGCTSASQSVVVLGGTEHVF